MSPETNACASCGEAIPASGRFCPFCGAPVFSRDAAPRDPGAEHRQITVMFCDLMESTALSNRLDIEDLRDVLRHYQWICAEAIEAREGAIGQYLGDGVLAQFGYPKASESAALHATDAALDIVEAVAAEKDIFMRRYGVEIATRVALHTGRVLIGDMGAGQTRDRHALTGAVPNLAARLEGIAPKNGVAISARTAAQISGAFEIESLGKHDLKGFPEPVEAFHVLRRRAMSPIIPENRAYLFGRESELARLDAVWQRMESEASEHIAVIAEPGMGKSALASAFLSSNGIGQDRVIGISGTLKDRNTPFACLRRTIERWTALGLIRDAEPASRQIAQWFGVEAVADSPHATTFHHVLNGEIDAGNEGREQVLAACRAYIASLGKPMVILLEDAHWIDPSTAEMIERVTPGTDGIMVLALRRPVEEKEESEGDNAAIHLSPLDDEACKRLVEGIADGAVQPALVRMIADVSAGLPLFVEEFTKSLTESASIQRIRGVLRPIHLDTKIATPESLLDLITVRLDSLGKAKALAQICAVLGRSFSRPALAAVSDEPEADLDEMITRLIDARILVREWSGELSFRHALFQTAAYESLVRSERQHWHGRFLDWLQAKPARMEGTPPDTIGLHLEACGRGREAVDHYLEAGLLADRASASLEAATHFRKCCDLLGDIEGLVEPDALPLRAQVLLANALLSARGPGAPETRAAFEVATELADALPESEWHFAAWWGWWRVSDSFATMAQRAAILLTKSETMQGLEFRLQAMHCVWANAFQMGELDVSIRNAREGLALYDAARAGGTGTYYGGHDCKVCALGEIALARWLTGAGDAATRDIEIAIEHAQHLDHAGSLLHALDIAVMLHHYRRDTAATKQVAERLRTLATTGDLEDYRAKGEIFAGWVEIEAGNVRAGLTRVEDGFATMREIGTPEDFPVYQCIRADAMIRLGDTDGAVAALAEGRAVIAAEGVNYWGAEIARLEAVAEMTRGGGDPARVTTRLDDACALAGRQGALALELRACLTRLDWAHSGHVPLRQAQEALRSVRERFPRRAKGREIADADAALASLCVQ